MHPSRRPGVGRTGRPGDYRRGDGAPAPDDPQNPGPPRRIVRRPISRTRRVVCVARHVLAAVDPERYDAEPVGITRDGDWVLAEGAVARARRRRRSASTPSHRRRPSRRRVADARLADKTRAARRSTHGGTPRSCTVPSARTGRCRGCSSWPACPTSAPECSPRRCAWTRSRQRTTSPPMASRSAAIAGSPSTPPPTAACADRTAPSPRSPPSSRPRWQNSACRCS